ncbi:MAG: S8 family serine peptidase [Sphingomonadales bacterium]|nr:S8 family serine peptidase [Sphingomonadales bacterium]MBD3773495.1 S8 family serine peptidase [Paracoccaceae bacterium]
MGYAGLGAIIAIVDSGIDSDSPEFAGRISPASADVAGARGIDNPDDDHGTNVALIAAAARDDTGVLGIAWQATILTLRADSPGTCADTSADGGCGFSDSDIAKGIDRAVANGAAVINISLGGSAPNSVVRQAVQRAAAAGVVVIVSAGNDGDSTDVSVDPNNPDPFAAGLVDAGNGNVIIVGSVDAAGVFSDFSNRAGSYAASFISARGEAICCVYKDGVMDIGTNPDGSRYVTLISGTSFSAPQVSGAVALLAQAFPNLTAQEIVQILLTTARDAGDAGVDAIYGAGILDIARAFTPQGTTTIAGSTTAVVTYGDGGGTSTPMGDALIRVTLPTLITDKYDRAFTYDAAAGLQSAAIRPKLAGAVGRSTQDYSAASEKTSLAFTVGEPGAGDRPAPLRLAPEDAQIARVLAARVAMKIAPDAQLAFGFAQGADGLVAQLQGQDRPAFLIAGEGRGDDGFARASDMSVAFRQRLGSWGLTFSADRGQAWLASRQWYSILPQRVEERHSLASIGVAADRRIGPVEAALGLGWLAEGETVLGAWFDGPLGRPGADSLFIDASAAARLGGDWRLGGSFRQGFTRARSNEFVTGGSRLASQAWSLDLSHANLLASGDSIALRVSQPLRVTGGGLSLWLPVSYDYATETAIYGTQQLSLAPQGREVDGEIAWRGPLWGGDAAMSLFYRTDPGHDARLPDDKGVAIKWHRRF